MGRCQGRYCESSIASLLSGAANIAPDARENLAPRDELFPLAPRVPAKPIRIRDLLQR